MWLYLTKETSFLKENLKVLHVAPEQVFYAKFKNLKKWDYTTTDLHSPIADIKADLCDLPFDDNQYDLILCNHVLEHIPNDIKAMRELYRVLKKDGTLIAQVPLEENRDTTFEDDTIIDKKERTRIFGQYDHLRVYGKDYYFRLQSVGFKAEGIDFLASLSDHEKESFALPKQERIPVAIKK